MISRIGLVGCGTVGSGLIELLRDEKNYLRERYGVEFAVVFVTDALKGTVFSKSGLDESELTRGLETGDLRASPWARVDSELTGLLRDAELDILCEATPTNYQTGEPGMTILKTALSNGVSVATSGKGAVGLDLIGLKETAARGGALLRFESSVMSGTPLINLVRGPLAGCSVLKAEGILNGTTNYILTRMEGGMSYGEALKEAQRLGYAETDPAGDVEGFDAAVKICILAAEFFGARIGLSDVERVGITGVTLDDIKSAAASGQRIKLIASVERLADGSVRGRVAPRVVSSGHPLASIDGAVNAVSLTTDNLGEVTIVGPGAGKRATAQGLLSDMLDIALSTKRVP